MSSYTPYSSIVPMPKNYLRGLPYEAGTEDNVTKIMAEELRKNSIKDCKALEKMWLIVEENKD